MHQQGSSLAEHNCLKRNAANQVGLNHVEPAAFFFCFFFFFVSSNDSRDVLCLIHPTFICPTFGSCDVLHLIAAVFVDVVDPPPASSSSFDVPSLLMIPNPANTFTNTTHNAHNVTLPYILLFFSFSKFVSNSLVAFLISAVFVLYFFSS